MVLVLKKSAGKKEMDNISAKLQITAVNKKSMAELLN